MNVPTDVIKHTVDALKGSPILLVVLILNLVVFAGFGFVIWQVSNAMERREAIIRSCFEGRQT
jgi:hypothetical protein